MSQGKANPKQQTTQKQNNSKEAKQKQPEGNI